MGLREWDMMVLSETWVDERAGRREGLPGGYK